MFNETMNFSDDYILIPLCDDSDEILIDDNGIKQIEMFLEKTFGTCDDSFLNKILSLIPDSEF